MRPFDFPTSCLLSFAVALNASADTNQHVEQRLRASLNLPNVQRLDIGVTRKGTKIPSLRTAADLDYKTPKTRILIVGTHQAVRPEDSSLAALAWFHSATAEKYRNKFLISVIPAVHPDRWIAEPQDDAADGAATDLYPPQGEYYHGDSNTDAQYVWRWIGMFAPDLVIAVGRDSVAPKTVGLEPQATISSPASQLPALHQIGVLARRLEAGPDLVSQLATGRPSDVGAIPALRIDGRGDLLIDALKKVMDSEFASLSPARREIQRRIERTPIQIAQELSQFYGHSLDPVVYIPSVALSGRLRLGELTGDDTHLAAVQKIAAPYANRDKPSLPAKPSSSHLSGHLVFAALADATGDVRYSRLVQDAADLGFDEAGLPKVSMPLHNEMSDSVFMGCPILVEAGKLSGDDKFFAMALRHLDFMQKLCLRDDGLYRHSPLDETAWGRGNAFPALGLALCLTSLPETHAGRDKMLRAFQSHLEVLAEHQDVTGMWHQVIDHSGSYREFSSTTMITFAMVRGMREGWLSEAKYRPIVQRAWTALTARIGPQGRLVDVCTGTGKQKNLQAYLDRTAILGRDDRGGAMALLLATEMAAWERSAAE